MSNVIHRVLKDGHIDRPFVPQKKSMDFGALGLGAVMDIANLGMQDYWQGENRELQDTINKRNIQMQKETNAQNYKMFQEQNQFNLDMWNKNNEYNDPTNVAARLRRAGVNPADAFGSGAYQPSALESASPSPMVAPHADPYVGVAPQFEAKGAIAAVNAYLQNQMVDADVRYKNSQSRNIDVATDFDYAAFNKRLQQLETLIDKDKQNADVYRLEADYLRKTVDMRVSLQQGNLNLLNKQIEGAQKEIEYKQLMIDLANIQKVYAPKLQEAELRQVNSTIGQIAAQTALINSNRLLTDEQKLSEIERRVGQTIDNGLKGLDLDTQRKLKPELIKQAKSQSQILKNEGIIKENEQRNWKSGERLRRFTSAIPFIKGL